MAVKHQDLLNQMIPTFPNFKSVDIEDRALVEMHTSKYHPYSDFNFSNLWAWDVKGQRKIAELHGNLVVLFTDYQTCESFFSFLGNNKIKQTVHDLVEYAELHDISTTLRFIPEETVHTPSSSALQVTEDPENFDYIFSVSELSSSQGLRFKKKRHLSNKFARENPEAVFELKDFRNHDVQNEIVRVFNEWSKRKGVTGGDNEVLYEHEALNRLIKTAQHHNMLVSTISLQGRMVAFSIDEVLSDGYALAHFLKADNSFKGVYEFLNERTARYLKSIGVTLWNWEQDLNIEGLRKLKMSYRPVCFLKKYRLSLKNKAKNLSVLSWIRRSFSINIS